MLLSRTAWGVDLTGGAVQAVHVEQRGTDFLIIDVIDQPYSAPGEGSEALRAHLPEGVGRALTDLLRSRHATLGDPVFIALPTFGARQGTIELPVSDPAAVAGLIDFELHQLLGGDLEPWIVQCSEPERRSGPGLFVHWFAQRRELVATFVADVRRTGLPMDGLVPGPLALARYVALEFPGKGRRLFLEVHRTRTDFVYIDERGVRLRTVPIGCGCLAEPGLAGQVRRPDPNQTREITRLATQLVREHQRARVSLFGAHDGTTLERVILLGDGARHEELKATLADLLQTDVGLARAPRHFSLNPRLLQLGRDSAHSRLQHEGAGALHHVAFDAYHFGTALGLAVGALDRAGEPASFVSPPPARRAARLLPVLSTALLLVAASLLTLHFMVGRTVERHETRLAAVAQQVPWSASEQWQAARDAAVRAALTTKELSDRSEALHREVTFPNRLLQALCEKGVFYRLVEFELTAKEGHDEARLVFEVPDRWVDAAESIRSHLEHSAGVKVTAVESSPPAATAGAANEPLRVTLQVNVEPSEEE